MRKVTARWIKSFVAVAAGNALYFTLRPHLPPTAQHEPFQLDLGILVDFWFCLFVYGLVELVAFLRRRHRT